MKPGEKLVIFLATGCFVGKAPVAPGTFGSLAALPLCFIVSFLPQAVAWAVAAVLIVVAVIVADTAEKFMVCKDPGCVVIDEIVGQLITLIGIPFNLATAGLGFIIFRILDIFKPPPIGFIDKRLRGGPGIVLDDVAAGVIGNLLLRGILYTASGP